MKYAVGDYLAATDSVLLRIVAVLDGAFEIYGVVSIKAPLEVQWFTLSELKHEGYRLAQFNPHEFADAKVGDHVAVGNGQYATILAEAGTALLLSQVKSDRARLTLDIVGHIQEASGTEVMTTEMRDHLKRHASSHYAQTAADDWYDREVMALMSWKLVKE